MIRYRIVSAASAEVNDAASFYNDEETGLGVEFLDAIDEKINRVLRFPRLGSPISQRVRALSLDRFPFRIIYYLQNNELVVIAVAHQSRHPEYWRDRM